MNIDIIKSVKTGSVLCALQMALMGAANADSYRVNPNANRASVYHSVSSFGVGVGIGFGVAGVAIDHALSDRLVLTGALGTFPTADEILYSVGAKFVLKSRGFWKPRVSVLYGANSVVETPCVLSSCSDDSEFEFSNGFSIGLGQQFLLGRSRRHALDLDFFLPLDSEDSDAATLGNNLTDSGWDIKISFGYRFNF